MISTRNVRSLVKSMINRSSPRELIDIYRNDNFETKLSKEEQLIIIKKICENCRYHSFAFNSCENIKVGLCMLKYKGNIHKLKPKLDYTSVISKRTETEVSDA